MVCQNRSPELKAASILQWKQNFEDFPEILKVLWNCWFCLDTTTLLQKKYFYIYAHKSRLNYLWIGWLRVFACFYKVTLTSKIPGVLRRVQFCPQNMQCPSASWESENPTKTNVIQKLCSKPGSTRSVLTSKTQWSCFFTILPFVQTLSPVLQLEDSEPAFRCKIVNCYCLCCRTDKTGNNCSKKTPLP